MLGHDPALMAKLPKEYLEENIGRRLTVVCIVFLVVQTIFVIFFYLSRHFTKTLKGIDCWLLMPLGFFGSTGLCILGILMVQLGGGGHHVEAVLLSDPKGLTLMRRSKLDKAVEYFDYMAISGSKLVILYLYMRIFNQDRRYRIATYITAAIILLTWLTTFIATFTFCKPYSAYWTHKGKCGDIITIWRYVSVPNLFTDVMMLLLPLPALYKLHINVATKIGLFATFMVGSAGMITSILRMITFMHAEDFFKDPTYKCIPTMVYTVVEASTYLIASCMPALRTLKRHYFGDHSFARQIGTFLSKTSKSIPPSFGTSKSWKKEGSPKESSEGIVQLNELPKSGLHIGFDRRVTISYGDNDGFYKLNGRTEFV